MSDSDVLAREKETWADRTEAFRSLVRIAEHEYFDEKLGDLLDTRTVAHVLPDIREVVARGLAELAARRPQRFDLATQLVDLAAAVATVDAATAVSLAQDVLSHDAGYRVLVHAVAVVQRAKRLETGRFADYLSTVGDDRVRAQVKQALA